MPFQWCVDWLTQTCIEISLMNKDKMLLKNIKMIVQIFFEIFGHLQNMLDEFYEVWDFHNFLQEFSENILFHELIGRVKRMEGSRGGREGIGDKSHSHSGILLRLTLFIIHDIMTILDLQLKSSTLSTCTAFSVTWYSLTRMRQSTNTMAGTVFKRKVFSRGHYFRNFFTDLGY